MQENKIYFTVVLFITLLQSEGLLSKGPGSGGHMDKVVEELQHNVTVLYHQLEIVSANQLNMTIREEKLNLTLNAQQRTISELE